MNYGLSPVNECETFSRESAKRGGGAVSKKGSPFFLFSWYHFMGFYVFKGYYSNINLL